MTAEDPLAALPDLRRALAFEGSLRSRTEGLTWMVWGLVTAAIFLSYELAGRALEAWPWWAEALWVPWVAAGAAFTFVLWRTAALGFSVGPARPAGLRVTALFLLAGAAGWAVALLVLPGRAGEVVPLLAVGTAWLSAGAFDLARATERGRRVLMVVGALVCLAALGSALAFPAGSDWRDPAAQAAREAVSLVAVLVSGLVPFLAGLWQASRG